MTLLDRFSSISLQEILMLVPKEYYHHLECPKCHKHTVVQQSKSLYSCINCDFRRDLSMPRLGDVGGAILAIVTTILLIAIM